MISKETGGQATAEGEGTTIQAAVLMQRLVAILDDVCGRLSDVQGAVSDYVGTGQLDHAGMERLQSLDALTQEVEAVRAVLARVEEASMREDSPHYGMGAILAGVKLSQIRDMLCHGRVLERGDEHGDFTLF
ncbi:hypothetical protein [Bombella mellum]|uniref:Uncharacterized protein n=1 Tax=Bombella mellum TaxID=2039288 RepID=A0ABR5ZT38_9PROT|nr:hypothetical protein [Bombella mellum]MBA5727487.1 hypothetical protein [Bombella mellum]